jgi:uncharacterized caspase-like protein
MNTKTLHSRRCPVTFFMGCRFAAVGRDAFGMGCHMSKLGSLTAAAVFGMMVAIASCADAAEHRVALVVGNSNYKTAGMSLPNPRNDAADVSEVLRDLDFEVIAAFDATKDTMESKLEEFARKAATADTVLFFYAGHAMQYEGQNFLVPTDAELVDKFSLRHRMVALADVQSELEGVNGVKIMILDACRNNPLADRFMARTYGLSRAVSQTRGLARVDKTEGMVIAYATAPDATAQDGTGRNSPFTTALLKRLREPGRPIVSMFQLVTGDVQNQTLGKQRPEIVSQLSSEFVLNQSDRFVWETIDQDDPDAMGHFFEKFPSSPLAVIARNRYDLLMQLKKEREEFARQAAEAQRIAQEAAAARRADEERKQAEAERQRIEQLAAQRRLEEEQKRIAEQNEQKRLDDDKQRQESLRQQLAEQKRLDDEKQRQETLRQQLAEQKRLDDEKKQQESLRLHRAEQKRLDDEQKRKAELNQQAEKNRLAELDQQAEQKRLDEVQKRLADGWRAELEAADRQKAADETSIKLATGESKEGRPHAPNQEPPADPIVTAALGSLPPAASPVPKAPTVDSPNAPALSDDANTPRQIRKAQQELRRLACFDGRPDGNLDPKTEQAVKNYWTKTGHKDAAEVKITDAFITELEQQDEDVCKPGRTKQAPAVVIQSPPKHQPPAARQTAQHDTPAPKLPREQTAPSARPAPRPAEDPHAKATTLFLGVGH